MDYVWEQADKFSKKWLIDCGYKIIAFEKQEDCVGYRCERRGVAYTVFVYAFGEQKTALLDGDYCAKLNRLPFSKQSIVLVLYLHVEKTRREDGTITYLTQYYDGEPNPAAFWRPVTVMGRNILEFYPGKEVVDMCYRFMAAFNNRSIDTLEAILDSDAYAEIVDGGGKAYNDGILHHLMHLRNKYGKMKLSYLRNNDVIFFSMPYLERYGYFGFSVSQINDKIVRIQEYALDGNYEELWVIDTPVDDCQIDIVPEIRSIVFLEPELYQRFALKIHFDNGEIKKYILPVEKENKTDEVVQIKGEYLFTDKIWRNGWITASRTLSRTLKSGSSRYIPPNSGQGVQFINGFSLGKVKLYHDSTYFYEPAICDDTVFQNKDVKVIKVADWANCRLYFAQSYPDEEEMPDIIKVILPGSRAFNDGGTYTFADMNGKRITNLDFRYIDDFQDDIIKVGIKGQGYGYMNRELSFITQCDYQRANEFSEGHAAAITEDGWNVIIDRNGNEVDFQEERSNKKYAVVCECSEGLFKVSKIDMRAMDWLGQKMLKYRSAGHDDCRDAVAGQIDDKETYFGLAYHHDDMSNAGIWGYVDTGGFEVIEPQYIFASDFENGIAIVCKGKWEYKDQWDERESTDGWWSEEMLWGVIDKNGTELVPLKFDELQYFHKENYEGYDERYFKVHYGGWPEGNWGVIDRKGNWVVEPIFEDIDHIMSEDGCFAFYEEDRWNSAPMGIYSIQEKCILFPPQFEGVEFTPDGNFIVELYDDSNSRIVKKIDSKGNRILETPNPVTYTEEEPYIVRREHYGQYNGLLSRDGAEVLPFIFDEIDIRNGTIIARNEKGSSIYRIGV